MEKKVERSVMGISFTTRSKTIWMEAWCPICQQLSSPHVAAAQSRYGRAVFAMLSLIHLSGAAFLVAITARQRFACLQS